MEFNENQKRYLTDLLYDCSEIIRSISVLLGNNNNLEYSSGDIYLLMDDIDSGKTTLDFLIRELNDDYQNLLRNDWIDDEDEE